MPSQCGLVGATGFHTQINGVIACVQHTTGEPAVEGRGGSPGFYCGPARADRRTARSPSVLGSLVPPFLCRVETLAQVFRLLGYGGDGGLGVPRLQGQKHLFVLFDDFFAFAKA